MLHVPLILMLADATPSLVVSGKLSNDLCKNIIRIV